MAAILLSYSAAIGLLSVAVNYNGLFFVFALTARAAAFVCLLVLFSSLSSQFVWPLILATGLALVGVAIVSGFNVYNDTKAYYGFVQIPSTWAPGTSGFFLSIFAISLHSVRCLSVRLTTRQRKWLLALSIIFSVLGFFTFSMTAIIVLSAYWISIIILGVSLRRGAHLFSILIPISGGILVLLLLWGWVRSTFWRMDWFWYKLNYRFDKVEGASSQLCSDVSCYIFGIGPGAHSFHNGSELGRSSVLSFDSLHGRIFLEWGVLGSLMWVLFLMGVCTSCGNIRSAQVWLFISCSILLGFGYEYFFEAYSGSLFAILFGLVLKASREKNPTV
ncbi:hypothetical protein LSUCC0246_10000 [Rhodobacterales bacterium LSUCC0246]|nr:hypothetical protein [Rhodobacterales bacterium LSUCC0374]